MERGFGHSLANIRVHSDAEAAALAERQNANALSLGNDLFFGAGKYKPGTDAGDRLLSHEIAHALQQTGSGRTETGRLEAEARHASENWRSGLPVGWLSSTAPRVLRDTKAEKTPPVLQSGIYFMAVPSGVAFRFPTAKKMQANLLTGADQDFDIDPLVIGECDVKQVGAMGTEGMKYEFIHPDLGRILDMTSSDSTGGSWSMDFYWLPPVNPGGTGTSKGGGGTSANAKKQAPEQLLDLKTHGPSKDVEETMTLYQQVEDKLPHDPDNDGGDEAIRFARFLEMNKDKIDGILPPGKKGKGITQAQVQQIIDLYGKFIVAKPMDTPSQMETKEDFDKVFKYDPNWQKMSKQDKQMMLDYAKMSPEDLKAGKFETSKLSNEMKEQMALRLSDSWPSEILDAAKEAFTDPAFLISLVLTIAIYIGLWLTPDPTFITKLAAGTLTVVMWSMFAWNDIWETMEEYSAFEDNVKQARTAEELKAAGNRLGRKIGAVGFDILMMIATWGLGKAAGPKLRAKGVKMEVARAETARGTAMSDPAAGMPKAAQGPAAKLLDVAKSNAKGSTATAVLDALEPALDPAAKQGLQSMRASGAGDINTVKALEGQAGRGNDIGHFLEGKAATPEAVKQAKIKLMEAEARVARAKLMETETTTDPKLRAKARSAQMADLVRRFMFRLTELNLLEDPEVKRIMEDPEVKRQLAAEDEAAIKQNVEKLRGALGEAIARQQLTAGLADPSTSRVVSNLAVVEEVPGYKTIAEWKAATNASPKDVARMVQGKNAIYRTLGEIDAMVVEDVPNAKPRVSVIEEVKTGANDQHQSALGQITEKVQPGLDRMNAGDTRVRVFELDGKELGSEQTHAYDFTGKIEAQTRGPVGKVGFDNSLGFDSDVLKATAESLIRSGPPPKGGPTMVPIDPGEKKRTDE